MQRGQGPVVWQKNNFPQGQAEDTLQDMIPRAKEDGPCLSFLSPTALLPHGLSGNKKPRFLLLRGFFSCPSPASTAEDALMLWAGRDRGRLCPPLARQHL